MVSLLLCLSRLKEQHLSSLKVCNYSRIPVTVMQLELIDADVPACRRSSIFHELLQVGFVYLVYRIRMDGEGSCGLAYTCSAVEPCTYPFSHALRNEVSGLLELYPLHFRMAALYGGTDVSVIVDYDDVQVPKKVYVLHLHFLSAMPMHHTAAYRAGFWPWRSADSSGYVYFLSAFCRPDFRFCRH